MEPPKIIREADPQEGRGCWMGCFGIGCLIIIVGFIGLLVGGWYSLFHTRLPLMFIEQVIEEDGKVEIEGLTGSVSKGFHIDHIKFLTVDDEHWSELHGIKFDYNGLISSGGRIVVERMSVDRGTIYAEIEGPDDFLFSPSDLNDIEQFRDSDFKEFRVKLLEVNNLKIVNLDTDYSVEVETASLKDFYATGKDGIVDLGQLTIKSNVLEAETESSTKWPESLTAKRIRGNLRAKFSDQMKQDVDFAVDLEFEKSNERRSVSMFKNAWVQEFSEQQRLIQLTDFSPEDYFDSDQILPRHIQLVATHAKSEAEAESEETKSEDPSKPEITWELAPGASFQLGKTTFQIESVAGNQAPLRAIVGKATVNGEVITAELRCRDYFQKGRIELKVDQHLADRTDWAHVVFGSDFESLGRDEQRLLEATIEASKAKSEPADPDSKDADADAESEDQKVEKDESTEPYDDTSPQSDPPSGEKAPPKPNPPEKDHG